MSNASSTSISTNVSSSMINQLSHTTNDGKISAPSSSSSSSSSCSSSSIALSTLNKNKGSNSHKHLPVIDESGKEDIIHHFADDDGDDGDDDDDDDDDVASSTFHNKSIVSSLSALNVLSNSANSFHHIKTMKQHQTTATPHHHSKFKLPPLSKPISLNTHSSMSNTKMISSPNLRLNAAHTNSLCFSSSKANCFADEYEDKFNHSRAHSDSMESASIKNTYELHNSLINNSKDGFQMPSSSSPLKTASRTEEDSVPNTTAHTQNHFVAIDASLLDSLVDTLTNDEHSKKLQFRHTVISVFGSFTHSLDLLCALWNRYRNAVQFVSLQHEESLFNERTERFCDDDAPSTKWTAQDIHNRVSRLQISVFAVLKTWLLSCPQDFSSNDAVMNRMKEELNSIIENESSSPCAVLMVEYFRHHLQSVCHHGVPLCQQSRLFTQHECKATRLPVKLSARLNSSHINHIVWIRLLPGGAKQFAHQLTLLTFDEFKRISHRELIVEGASGMREFVEHTFVKDATTNIDSSSKPPSSSCEQYGFVVPNSGLCLYDDNVDIHDHFQYVRCLLHNVRQWVTKLIVYKSETRREHNNKTAHTKDRVKTITFFVEVARELLKLNNTACLYEVFRGLTSRKAKASDEAAWQRIALRHIAFLVELKNKFSPANMQKHSLVRVGEYPAIPLLNVVVMKLRTIMGESHHFVWRDECNAVPRWDRIFSVQLVLDALSRCQMTPYTTLVAVSDVQSFIRSQLMTSKQDIDADMTKRFSRSARSEQ